VEYHAMRRFEAGATGPWRPHQATERYMDYCRRRSSKRGLQVASQVKAGGRQNNHRRGAAGTEWNSSRGKVVCLKSRTGTEVEAGTIEGRCIRQRKGRLQRRQNHRNNHLCVRQRRGLLHKKGLVHQNNQRSTTTTREGAVAVNSEDYTWPIP
jgi:hypothetical protein